MKKTEGSRCKFFSNKPLGLWRQNIAVRNFSFEISHILWNLSIPLALFIHENTYLFKIFQIFDNDSIKNCFLYCRCADKIDNFS